MQSRQSDRSSFADCVAWTDDAAYRLWSLPVLFEERSLHPRRIVEPHGMRHQDNRLRTVLQAQAGRLNPKPFDGFGGSLSGLPAESASELTGIEPRGISKAFKRKRFCQVLGSESESDPRSI